jgi:hypothetical protein
MRLNSANKKGRYIRTNRLAAGLLANHDDEIHAAIRAKRRASSARFDVAYLIVAVITGIFTVIEAIPVIEGFFQKSIVAASIQPGGRQLAQTQPEGRPPEGTLGNPTKKTTEDRPAIAPQIGSSPAEKGEPNSPNAAASLPNAAAMASDAPPVRTAGIGSATDSPPAQPEHIPIADRFSIHAENDDLPYVQSIVTEIHDQLFHLEGLMPADQRVRLALSLTIQGIDRGTNADNLRVTVTPHWENGANLPEIAPFETPLERVVKKAADDVADGLQRQLRLQSYSSD